MTYHEDSSEFINRKHNFVGLDDESNIRPLYKNKIRNSCRLTGPAGQQNNGAVQDSSTDFLGYDWIASMVDNQIRPICKNISNCQVNISANHYVDDEEWLNQREFFDKLNAFRQTNSDLCCSQRPLSLHKTSTKINHNKSTLMNVRQRVRPLPPIRTNNFSHNDNNLKPPTIVQNYTLNSRLFPVRTDVIAGDRKHEEKADSPIVLRISIPSHRLKNTKFLNESFNVYKKHNPLSTSYPLKNTISLIGHCDYSVGTKR
ncbi:hypothetical protein Smp_129100 [Schistosoma mansoni]|uniref:hypothetical protein n=1 Tax=Schistosoma mansoni TaxID=6183 RepID=UPI0001A63120|nr:hypothetical protein Smp_129100 [Schistosoma mansoni]|eukprot:XP_018648176.1 hypothetical protein Smp_129100 [Schistosoma mansoni]